LEERNFDAIVVGLGQVNTIKIVRDFTAESVVNLSMNQVVNISGISTVIKKPENAKITHFSK
jgi:hypothetical protein